MILLPRRIHIKDSPLISIQIFKLMIVGRRSLHFFQRLKFVVGIDLFGVFFIQMFHDTFFHFLTIHFLQNAASGKKNFFVNLLYIIYLSLPPTRHDLTQGQEARRPIKVGIKGRGRSGTSRDSNPACLCCSSAHLVQYEPDEASSFTNPNVGPGTYASLRLKLDAWSSAVQGGQRRQKCSSPTRR